LTAVSKPARWLCIAAVICWLASLALPGFFGYHPGKYLEVWYGISILPFGLLFGWACKGWAVYANIFFFIVLARVLKGKSAGRWVLLMILLAATFPFFGDAPDSDWSPPGVTTWGWGVVVWLTALSLATAASAVQQQWLTMRQAGYGLAVGLIGVYALAAFLHQRQWAKANTQDRELYLPAGAVYAVAPLCDVPFVWPEGPLVGPDEIVELDIDPALKATGSPHISLPSFDRYQAEGFTWVTYDGGGVKVRYVGQPRHFTFQAKTTGQGAVIRLVQNATGQVLYEQNLHLRRPVGHPKGSMEYCPRYWAIPKVKGYTNAIKRILGPAGKPALESRPQLAAEIAREPCDMGEDDIDGIKNLRTLDGRQVIMVPDSLRPRKYFCSPNYIASARLLSVLRSGAPSDWFGYVKVFDRRTLQPLAIFRHSRTCGDGDRSCTTVALEDAVTGIQIAADQVTLETTQGERQIPRARGE
jgi:hypothetical protein